MKDVISRNQFVELRALGYSFSRIAEELSISKKTAIAWSRELVSEIERRRREILEEIQNELALNSIQRVKKLGEQFLLFEGLLGEVDLSQLKARDVFNYYLKFEKRISEIAKEDNRRQSTSPEQEGGETVEQTQDAEAILPVPWDTEYNEITAASGSTAA